MADNRQDGNGETPDSPLKAAVKWLWELRCGRIRYGRILVVLSGLALIISPLVAAIKLIPDGVFKIPSQKIIITTLEIAPRNLNTNVSANDPYAFVGGPFVTRSCDKIIDRTNTPLTLLSSVPPADAKPGQKGSEPVFYSIRVWYRLNGNAEVYVQDIEIKPTQGFIARIEDPRIVFEYLNGNLFARLP